MKKARILIVEDEELVGLAIRTHLESMEYDVPAVVATGEEALREVRSQEPDLVLMDIHLRGPMDGIQAAAIIKDSSRVPVIFLTAFSDGDTLSRAKLTDPYGYVLKPFDERALEASIEMALHKAAEQRKLLHARERLTSVLHSLGDGIIVAGMKGGIEYVNETAAELLGLTLPLPASTSIARLLKVRRHRDKQEISLPLQEVILNGNRVGYRACVLVTEQGTRRTVDLNLEPYKDEQDMVRGIVLAFRDSTEPRRVEGLVEEELAAAASLHASLLPANGAVASGVEVQGFLFPASFSAGDLYNVYPIGADHAGIFIIDVMGHGIMAASTAHLAARLLAPSAEQKLPFLGVSPLSPLETVGRLNELFTGFGGGSFFTLCYGVIHLATGKVRLVRAGHPFPVVVRADGRAEDVRAPGHAVGLSPRLDLVETEIALARGDRLFLYSDGLTDCRNFQAEDFGREQLLRVLAEGSGRALAEAVSSASTALREWRGSTSFDDDITLVGVEVS